MDCKCLDFCLTEDERFKKTQNRRINEAIRECKRKDKTIFKLLLLGTGESGKSTFLRQMRIIYDNGYSDEDKREYISVILQNILESMQCMVEAMDVLNIKYDNKMNSRNAEVIKSANSLAFSSLTDVYLSALKELWDDVGIQECYVRRREYQLNDSIKYYMSHIDRLAEPHYLPTEGDILHVRVPTTGLVEYRFKVNQCEFRMIDVGGQRSQRKKWLNCFDKVKAVLFLVAISEYDQVLLESGDLNRLEESKKVFENICMSPWFTLTSMVAFFNKTDLLQEKIMYSDLVDYYPKYQGPHQDYTSAREFIANMFLEVMPTRDVYKHYTCATDTENIKVVFAVVRDTILGEYLKQIML